MTIVYVYLKATDVILTMTVEITVMKKDVVCTVRVSIIVSLYTHCLPIIRMFKCCPSYCYILGERKKLKSYCSIPQKSDWVYSTTIFFCSEIFLDSRCCSWSNTYHWDPHLYWGYSML